MKTLVSCTLAVVLSFGLFTASASANGYGGSYGSDQSYGLKVGQSYGKKGKKQNHNQSFQQQGFKQPSFQQFQPKQKKWNGPSQWNGSSQWNGNSQYHGSYGY